MTTALPLTLHLTREQRGEFGEPVRFEHYRADLPTHRLDVCSHSLRFPGSAHVCGRWAEHDGDHADLSPSGLVLEVWPRHVSGNAAVAKEKDALYRRLNQIIESAESELDNAGSELRRLLAKARNVDDNEELLEQIEHSMACVRAADLAVSEAGVDEEDWR